MATRKNTPKIRAKSAAVTIDADEIKRRLDAQMWRAQQSRSIVQSVRSVLNDENEGCDSWFALDVVQESLKTMAAELDEMKSLLHPANKAGAEVAHV